MISAMGNPKKFADPVPTPGAFGVPPTSALTVLAGTFAHTAFGSAALAYEMEERVRINIAKVAAIDRKVFTK